MRPSGGDGGRSLPRPNPVERDLMKRMIRAAEQAAAKRREKREKRDDHQ